MPTAHLSRGGGVPDLVFVDLAAKGLCVGTLASSPREPYRARSRQRCPGGPRSQDLRLFSHRALPGTIEVTESGGTMNGLVIFISTVVIAIAVIVINRRRHGHLS